MIQSESVQCNAPEAAGSRRLIRRYAVLALALWSLVLGASFAWYAAQERASVTAMAKVAAQANLNKDLAFRRWAASHGGVYVPVTEATPSNPYLEVPERDVTTNRGQRLTLMNPAYALRQLMGHFSEQSGIQGHITSLTLLNPKNAPDAWERRALLAFREGAPDATAVAENEGQRFLRYMRPMFMEAACMKCHSGTGVKVGEVRGGISTAIPLAPYEAQAATAIRLQGITHGGIWLVGVLAILFVARRACLAAQERARAEREIRQLNDRLEQRVAERTAELERAYRELESYSYSTSHDLRSPLRALNGYAHILLEAEGPRLGEESRKMLERIVHNSTKMGLLIDDLLDYARASRQPIERGGVNLDALARDVTGELHEEYPACKVSIAPLPAVAGDPVMLRQLLVNLIGNALKFSAQGAQPQVEIGVLECEGETRFFVRDNGAGFDMQYAGKLFGMFQRMHADSQFAGTGVGLAIAKRIVERHGGRIWAEAEPGRGSTFYFTLGRA